MNALRTTAKHFFGEERDALVLGLLRVALSVLLFCNGLRLVQEFLHAGYFAEYFHVPLIAEDWVPSRTVYQSLLGLQLLASLFAFLGVWPREALLTAASLGFYFLLCDRLQYHNNRYALLLLSFLLAFTPCDRSCLLARGRGHTLEREQRIAPTFARRLFQLQVSLIYLGSAAGKLLDADWRSGQVLLMRYVRATELFASQGQPLPAWLSTLLTSAWFASFAAKVAICSELSIALGLWLPRVRRLALWLGVLFHIGIELTAKVELFSWLMLASYLSFVTPEVRERRFEFARGNPRGEWLARFVAVSDWCVRFERRAFASTGDGPAFYVTNREGQRASGVRGLAQLSAAIPLLFPLWLPLALFVELTDKRAAQASSA